MVVLLASASVAVAGPISGTLTLTESAGDTENPVDLTAQGMWTWALYAGAVDDNNDGAYEPTEMKAGGAMVTLTPSLSGTGGNAYGNPVPADAIVETTNHEKPEYFTWSDGTNEVSGTKTDNMTFRHQNPLGWVTDSTRRQLYIDEVDADYGTDLAAYAADPDYGFGELEILVPVPAGDGTVNVFFGTRRVSFLADALLTIDGDTWISDLVPDGTDGVNPGDKTNNVLQVDYTASQAQDLLVTLTAQEVLSDTNRRFDIQAVAVDAIPEPATMSLLALGGLAVLRRRRIA
ncbi:MAG: PEP-CTERM sorting domain-containing protein [Phycisphaerae bacterium]